MNEEMREKLRRIASLSRREVGDSEESVKINFIVPFLECFGHKHLDFEYKYKDIIIKKDLHRSCKVIVETKNYDKNLEGELQQLERYSKEEQPLLSIIANGEQIRIFSPSWRFRRTFRDGLIYCIYRKDLKEDNIVRVLENIISRDNLETGKAKDYVMEREKAIEETEMNIEKIEEDTKKEEEKINGKIGELNKKIEDIKMEINNLSKQIADARRKKNEQIENVWKEINLPIPFITQIPSPTPEYPTITPPMGELPRAGQTISIELPKSRKSDKQPSWRKHNLIPVPRDYRSFFPGYEIDFSVDTDIGELKMYVTSAPKGTQKGDPVAGYYIKGDTIKWIRHHSELKPGDRLKFTVIEPHKKYRLEIA